MAYFYVNDTTIAGELLLAEVIANGGVFTPTKIAVGSGEMPQGAAAADMTLLVAQEAAFPINKKKRMPDGANAVIGGAFSNKEVAHGFTLREIGVFAKAVYADGSESEEVLYSYGNAGDQGDYIPAYSTSTIVERQIDITTYVGAEATVHLTVDSQVYVSVAAFEALQANLDETNRQLENTNQQHADDKEELLAAINNKPSIDHKHSTNDLTSGVLPYERGGTGVASKSALMLDIANVLYPVGSIYMSVKNTNPSQLFGGTWTEWGTGRVPVGVASDAEFNTVEKTGGSKTHTLTVGQMPTHSHNYNYVTEAVAAEPPSGSRFNAALAWNSAKSTATSNTGSNQAHNNLQPYITCYMWKRTA